MSKDDLQPTPEELEKLRSLQADVDVDFARRAKLKRILAAKRKLDAKRKLEATQKLDANRQQEADQASKAKAAATHALVKRQAAAAVKQAPSEALEPYDDLDDLDDLDGLEDLDGEPRKKPSLLRRLFGGVSAGDAIELAGEARQELEKPKEPGKKSLLWSGGLSLVGGPLGWLYAGSFREAVPAGAVYLGIATVVGKILPGFLLMPVAGVVLPISGLAGVIYAWQYNRKGKRVRLFGDGKKKKAKQLQE